MKKDITRREFLKRAGQAAAGLGFMGARSLLTAAASETETGTKKTGPDVVRLDCQPARLSPDSYNKDILKQKLDAGLVLLTNTGAPEKAWKELFSPNDIVGLKLNCLAGKGLSSTPDLVYAITDGLLQAGVAEDNIIIWDRFNRELMRAGFKINQSGSGIKCYGTERNYDPGITTMGAVGSCLSNIFLKCTALINIGVVKDHNLAGASIGMKNLYGIIHNPNKYHFDNCTPYVADISASKPVTQRMRLIVADALWAQYHNGPARDDHYRWEANTVLLATKPAPIDAVGINMIEEKRKEAGIKSLAEEGRAPLWLKTAGTLGLGETELANIKIATV